MKRAESALIVLTDRLLAALDRDREYQALARLDERAMKDIGRGPGDHGGF